MLPIDRKGSKPGTCTGQYTAIQNLLPQFSEVQSIIFENKKELRRAIKKLQRSDFWTLKSMLIGQEIQSKSICHLLRLICTIYLCHRSSQSVMQICQKACDKPVHECEAKELLPVLVKKWVNQKKYIETLDFLQLLSDSELRRNLSSLVLLDIYRAGKFDEVIEFTKNVAAHDGESEILTRQSLCREFVRYGEYLLSWKLAQSTTDPEEKSELIETAISNSFSQFQNRVDAKEDQFVTFLVAVIQDGFLEKCVKVMKENSTRSIDIDKAGSAIIKALIECKMYPDVLRLGEWETFQDLGASLLRKQKYHHAIGALACIEDDAERLRCLMELSEKFDDFGMEKWREEALNPLRIGRSNMEKEQPLIGKSCF